MGHHCVLLLLTLSAMTVWVSGQDQTPASFPFDCRRSDVGCNSGTCNIEDGTCDCATVTDFEGYDCGLQTSLKATTCTSGQCENNAQCLQGENCFCDTDTYGTKCENPRVKMWCTDSTMFININPRGSPFAGKIYLRKLDSDDARYDSNCQLTRVDDATNPLDLTQYDFVKTVNGDTPTLGGYFLAQDHVAPADTTNYCQAATRTDTDGRIDYIQHVLIEYNPALVTSVDQIVIFNCSVSSTTTSPITSENAASVTLDGDDYVPVNVTSEIVPVSFEIKDPETDTVITNSIQIGTDLDLVFTLQASAGAVVGSTIQNFKITGCKANNGQTVGEGETNNAEIEFLIDDCPASNSFMLFRGKVEQSTSDVRRTVIPLQAFRFTGDYDAVVFICTIKLCTQDELTADPTACDKNTCEQDGGGDTSEDSSDSSDQPTSDSSDEPSTDNTPAVPGRRKRAAGTEEAKVNNTIHVKSSLHNDRQTGTDDKDDNDNDGDNDTTTKEAEDEDCMQHSEVVLIIIIFVIVFVILVIALVAAVVNLLRSRQKVVGVPSNVSATTVSHSHYSLPRLSLNTSM